MRFTLLSLMVACTGPETAVKAGVPELVLDIDQVDFGEILLGRQATVELSLYNDGLGDLVIESVALDSLSSPDFTVVSTTPIVVEGGEYGGPSIRYMPDVVGQDFGRLVITSNDPDQPQVELDLAAFGVEPLVDVDPGTLWFGMVEKGDSRTLSVSVSARGTGTLNIQDMQLSDGADSVFAVNMVGGIELPYEMVSGTSFSMEVTYTATGTEPWEETLTLVSNDPTTPEFVIDLLANTEDDPSKNAPPVVEITDPNWGEYYLTGQPLPVQVAVYDQEDLPGDLYCYLLANDLPTGEGGIPDEKGQLSMTASTLGAGDTTIAVRCIDTGGETGEDEVSISVFNPKEPLKYTLAGGPTLFDYWSVDDDVAVYVNNTLVFSDTNLQKDTHPPLEFEAESGDTITIVASDVNYCQRSLDALTLHFGTNYSQPLNEDICESACPDDACYDSSLDWAAGEFFRSSYTISIP